MPESDASTTLPETQASGFRKPPASGPPSATGAAASAPRRKPLIDPRFIAPMFITAILLGAQLSFKVLESYPKTLAAIAASMLTEMILGKLIYGKVPHLASAYISGISVGILIRSPEPWPYILCSMIAVTSKYLIRVKGRHIWNPSNLAIAVMLIIAHEYVATLSIQWGNSVWPMLIIWTLGSIIIYRLKRFHICATYVLSFIAFAFLRSAILHDGWQTEIAPITGPMYQLFIFFMITDPKSTVLTKKGQILVAFLVAAVECALRLTGTFFAIHAPYYALFLVGPTANLIEIWMNSRKAASSDAALLTS